MYGDSRYFPLSHLIRVNGETPSVEFFNPFAFEALVENHLIKVTEFQRYLGSKNRGDGNFTLRDLSFPHG